MDTLFEKIFSPSKHCETSLIKKLTAPQVFMKNSNSVLENMPSEYQQRLIENSLYSTDFNNTEPCNSFKTIHDLIGTLNQNMLHHFPKVPPSPNLVIKEYNKLLSKSVDTVMDSISDLSILYNTNLKNTMKEHKTVEVASEESVFSDNFFMTIASTSPNKKAHFNSMKEHKTAEVASEGSLISDNLFMTIASTSPNKKAHFSTMTEHKTAEVASEGSLISDNLFMTIASSTSPNKKAHFNTMKEHKTTGVASEGSSVKDLVVSIADASSPNKKAHFNVTISKSVLDPLNKAKKVSKEDCNLTQQMANRKAKEMQKRSKKRRRRQKKSNSSSTISKEVQNHKMESNCAASPISTNEDKNCDILCDVTVSHNSKSVQIVLPNLSSFVVTIESGDDDTDWDTNSESEWLADDSDFQVSGLFVASFSATNACSSYHNKPESKEQELSLMEAKLKEVNRNWNEQNACLKNKPKSSTLVSFAADEELEEICPVEMYERKGEWEIFATERLRFKKRISELEEILNPCLLPEHRAKMYTTLYENVL